MKKKIGLLICLIMMVFNAMTVNAATPSTLYYKVHVSNIGWMSKVTDSMIAGTTGQNRKLESLIVYLTYGNASGITYRLHCSDIGWMPWKTSGQSAGTTGQNRAAEAVEIKLQNGMENLYDIYYRVHSQDYGWLGWAKNGETAGTTGYAKQMEAIEIRIVAKNAPFNRGSVPPCHVKGQDACWKYPVTNAYCTWTTKTDMSWSGYSPSSSRSSRPDHAGIDIASSSGDKKIYAAASGTVVKTRYNSANGNYVIIQHKVSNKTVYSFYAHLSKYSVAEGAQVSASTEIGRIGNTGSSSRGEHLHFAVVDTLWSDGSYYGYVPSFSGNKVSYAGVTYYNPVYLIKYNKLP